MALICFFGVELSSKGAPNLIESFMTLYFIKFLGQNFTAENLNLDECWTTRKTACHDTVDSTATVTDISPLHSVQTGSRGHPVSSPVGIGGSCPGVKRPGRVADRSPPSSAEVKNGRAIPPLPQYVLMRLVLN
jgi:hypothetical protein